MVRLRDIELQRLQDGRFHGIYGDVEIRCLFTGSLRSQKRQERQLRKRCRFSGYLLQLRPANTSKSNAVPSSHIARHTDEVSASAAESGPATDRDEGETKGSSSVQGSAAVEAPRVRESSILARLVEIVRPDVGRLAIGLGALVINGITNLSFPRIMGKAIDLTTGNSTGYKQRFFLTVAGIFCLGATASFVRIYSFGIVTERIAARMRKNLFNAMMRQDADFFDVNKSGELVSRLSTDVDVVAKAVTNYFASGIRSLNSAVGGTVMLLMLSPQLTLVSLSVLPVVGSGAMLYGKYARNISKIYQSAVANTSGFALERIANIATVRMFAREPLEEEKFAKVIDDTYQLSRQASVAQATFMAGLNFCVNSSLLAVLYFGGSLVAKGDLTVGSLTSFAMYSGMVGLGFSGLSQVFGDVKKTLGSSSMLFGILDKKPSESSLSSLTIDIRPENGEELSLVFDKVSFRYKTRQETPVLDDFSLDLRPGRVVALVGQSGAGKSTVGKLLTRLYQPTEGSILLNGIDVSKLNALWYREQIGVVSQEPVLFSGTIRENILYGKPTATEKEIVSAARQANADEFISSFPLGYDTPVGERGVQLSGGQKQRIAIARAVIKNPPILLLDEATSALDGESERLVKEALVKITQNRAVLVIAHRATTIRQAHEIAVMEGGKILEKGSFDELISQENSKLSELLAENQL